MKKIFALLSFIVCSTAGLWAVWEGNAGVGAARDFSGGSMLVRSDMFPRDTLIEIENLENGKKTTALVSGSSGIAGLLVNLSPEVAKALEVPQDKIVRVRINTTSKLSDDFLAEDGYTSADSDYNPALAVTNAPKAEKPDSVYADSDTVLFDAASLTKYPKPVPPADTVAEKIPEPEPEPIVPEEKAPVIAVEPEPEFTSEPDHTENAYLEKAGLKPPRPTADKTAAKNKKDKPKTETVTTTTTRTQIVTTETQPVAPAEVKPEPMVNVPITTEPEPKKTEPAKSQAIKAEPPKPVATVEGITKPAPKKKEITKPVDTIESIQKPERKKTETPQAVNTIAGITEPVPEKKAAPKAVSTVNGITLPVPVKKEQTKPVATVEGVSKPAPKKKDATKPVHTVEGIAPQIEPEPLKPVKVVEPNEKKAVKPIEIKPVTEVKPEAEVSQPKTEPIEVKPVEKVEKKRETTQTTTTVTVIEEPEQTIAQKAKKPPVIENVLPATDVAPIKIEPYIVQPDSKMYAGTLQKGKYYLQIANYKKETNVQGILIKYKQYPLAIEKLGSGTKTRYRVFVGPLKIDEMGAAMEQFYKFGFTDSFFKVIQ